MPERDYAVVGAGIVGLAVARELLIRHPGASLLVAEREREPALHQSGQNSGVLHSGLYYAPGSLKARLCRDGRERMLRFAEEHDIPVHIGGKLVVATDTSELGRLDDLHRRGTANGLQGLRMLAPEELGEFEPHARGVRALHVPETATIDFAEVTRTLARDVEQRGGTVRYGMHVTDLAALQARRVVTCAGTNADRMAALTGVPLHRVIPFRGDFFVLHERSRRLVREMIYPVPDPRFPFLGVHFTRRIDGSVWVGPNAVANFGRHLVSREMRRLLRRYWRTGVGELYRAVSPRAALGQMRRYIPALEPADLERGPSGVRAQVVDREGKLVDDFVLQRAENTVHVLNAPSPAATASLAIAAHVVDQLDS